MKKIKNLSVRSKLLITNMLMIIIPVLIVAGITSILMPAWVYFVNGMNPDAHLTDSLGFISVYQLQRNVSNLEKQISIEATVNSLELTTSINSKTGSKPNIITQTKENQALISTQILNICKGIDASGAMMAVLIDEETIYLTQGSTLDDIAEIFADVNENNDIYRDSMINSSHSGTVLINLSKLSTGETLRIIVANPTMTGVVGGKSDGMSENLLGYGDKLLVAIFVIAIIVVLLTNGLLAIISSKAILKPIEKLRTATHEIRDGNLDYEIGYESKNEIGQMCSDFDEMRKRLKQSVETQQRYEENRIEMIAGISHDLGTPLTSIKGYASGLIDGVADTPKKRVHYLKTIYNTANDMDKLVSQLSMSSKLDLDKVPFYFEAVDISSFFDDCREELSTTLARNNIKLNYENNLAFPLTVSIDSTQYRRAILNIIDNCIKYSKSEGCEQEVILRVYRDELNIRVVIADNGLGVPESEMEKIFYSFYRSDKSRTNISSGSGLGLSITRQIIERHQGRVRAEKSEIGGLAIIIDLPVIEKKDAEDEKENPDC